MANLTIAVDDELLRRARIKAVANGTSVNALVRDYLISFAGEHAMDIRAKIVANAAQYSVSSGPGGRTWTRDEVHDRS